MSTLTVTQQQASGRRAVAAFADFMDTPPDIRESLREALRESVPAEVTDEQIGWTLAGLGTSLIALVNVALANAGQVEDVIPPRMLAALCSAAEGFLTDPERADGLALCDRCQVPGDGDEFYTVNGRSLVCESCCDLYYTQCNDCEVLTDWSVRTLYDTSICYACRNQRYEYCDDCEGYYNTNEGCGESHPGPGCDCESPALEFSVRNDGEPMLQSDTRTRVTLPAGTISGEGLTALTRCIQQASFDLEPGSDERPKLYNLSYDLDQLGAQWQTRQGNYTKRLSRLAYQNYGLKLSTELMSKVGCVAREHSTAVDFEVMVTRDLNRPAEDFYHENSCWWGGYSDSRCALKSNGGYGLLSYDSNGYVSGRAWVMPIKLDDGQQPSPTFNTEDPDGFVVFNGYGDLGGYTAARIVSHMAGMTYRKVWFTCSPMYVNGEKGYLVAPEEVASKYDNDGSVRLGVNAHSDLYYTERTLTHV